MAKFSPTMPPDSAIIASCRSVRLRVEGVTAWALEWVATSGAVLIAGHVVETLLVQVRQVDHDAKLVAGARPAPCPRRSGPARCRDRRESGTARHGRRSSGGSRPGRASAGPWRGRGAARRGRGRSASAPSMCMMPEITPLARQSRSSATVRQTLKAPVAGAAPSTSGGPPWPVPPAAPPRGRSGRAAAGHRAARPSSPGSRRVMRFGRGDVDREEPARERPGLHARQVEMALAFARQPDRLARPRGRAAAAAGCRCGHRRREAGRA